MTDNFSLKVIERNEHKFLLVRGKSLYLWGVTFEEEKLIVLRSIHESLCDVTS